MAAVLGLDLDLVAEACRTVEGAWPANDNAPGQVVIAGTLTGVEAAGEAAKDARAPSGSCPWPSAAPFTRR